MVSPGVGLVVDVVVAEASVELADKLVAECSECLSVGLAGGALPIVERAAAR